MMLMLLLLTFTACGSDDDSNGSLSSNEKSVLNTLSGTWQSEDGSTTITFSPWSSPKEIPGVSVLKEVKVKFYGTATKTIGGIKTSYFFYVKTSSNIVGAYTQYSSTEYSVGDHFEYTYKIVSSNKITLNGNTYNKK